MLDDQLKGIALITQQTLLTMFNGRLSQNYQNLEKVLQSTSVNTGQSGHKQKKFKDDDNHDVAKWFPVLEAYAGANNWPDENLLTRVPVTLILIRRFILQKNAKNTNGLIQRLFHFAEKRTYFWISVVLTWWWK